MRALPSLIPLPHALLPLRTTVGVVDAAAVSDLVSPFHKCRCVCNISVLPVLRVRSRCSELSAARWGCSSSPPWKSPTTSSTATVTRCGANYCAYCCWHLLFLLLLASTVPTTVDIYCAYYCWHLLCLLLFLPGLRAHFRAYCCGMVFSVLCAL